MQKAAVQITCAVSLHSQPNDTFMNINTTCILGEKRETSDIGH